MTAGQLGATSEQSHQPPATANIISHWHTQG